MFKRLFVFLSLLLSWPGLASHYSYISESNIKFDQFSAFYQQLDKTLKGYQQVITAPGATRVFSFYGNKIWFHTRLDKLSDIEKLSNNSSHNQQMVDALGQLATSRKTFIQKFMPELSYQPQTPRLKPEQIKYVRKMRFYIKTDKVDVALNTMQKFRDVFAEKQIQTTVWVYTGYVDEGLPYIDIFRFAKSAEDYHQYENQVNQSIGYDNLSKLMQPFAGALAGEEVIEGKVLYW